MLGETIGPTASAATGPPTDSPTPLPTSGTPTRQPTGGPTPSPTTVPTDLPTLAPTLAPTSVPTDQPTLAPTLAPTNVPTGQPTLAPTVLASNAPSQSPTAYDGSASPFNLIYQFNGDASEADFDEAAEWTLGYLEDFFTMQFALNQFTNMESFNAMVTGVDAVTASVSFDLQVLFSADSMFTPGRSDLDDLIFAAFQEPSVSEFLMLLSDGLPSSNPISSTTSVIYERNRR